MRTLLVAAVPEELGGLPGATLGVGMVAAAASLGRLLARRRPDRVVLIGTAGAYPGGPPVGGVVCASSVTLASGTAALGLGYVPLHPAPIPGVPLGELPAVPVASCVAITTDPALAAQLGTHAAVEQMELWGVALACAGVPWSAVLGVTNDVGPGAHAQWLANRGRCESAAREAAASILAPLAPSRARR